jgi:aminoglycoside N3'-acetyltransferase
MEALIKIQSELKAPKNQFNKFGNYTYRSCEDILEAVKPLLLKHGCTLTVFDEVKQVGNIIYVEATASIQKGDEGRSVTAQAGINPDRKGMDIAQSFGASSSYARKYALNGLFLIDDTKDPDATNKHDSEPKNKTKVEDARPWLNKGEQLNKAMEYLRTGKGSIAKIEEQYRLSKEIRQSLQTVIDNL